MLLIKDSWNKGLQKYIFCLSTANLFHLVHEVKASTINSRCENKTKRGKTPILVTVYTNKHPQQKGCVTNKKYHVEDQ
jgi:hypothetical protein